MLSDSSSVAWKPSRYDYEFFDQAFNYFCECACGDVAALQVCIASGSLSYGRFLGGNCLFIRDPAAPKNLYLLSFDWGGSRNAPH